MIAQIVGYYNSYSEERRNYLVLFKAFTPPMPVASPVRRRPASVCRRRPCPRGRCLRSWPSLSNKPDSNGIAAPVPSTRPFPNRRRCMSHIRWWTPPSKQIFGRILKNDCEHFFASARDPLRLAPGWGRPAGSILKPGSGRRPKHPASKVFASAINLLIPG